MNSERLNAPVRPLITVLFAAAVVFGFVVGMIKPGEFLPVATLAIGFYFRQRDEARPNGGTAPGPTETPK